MRELVLVCIGGAVGSGARYLMSGWILQVAGPGFATGTLVVNLLGSFALAFVMYASLEASSIPAQVRLLVGTGLLGGFTTYSTFSYQTMRYLQEGAWGLAGLNVGATLVGCLLACVAGWALARWVFGG